MSSRESAALFLTERTEFLHLSVEPSVSGEGFDVVLRLDGMYSDCELAEAALDGTKQRIEELNDVPGGRRQWWIGPPWQVPF
jgi:hypothetical protein